MQVQGLPSASRHWWLLGDRAKARSGPDQGDLTPRATSRSGSPEKELNAALDLVARVVRLIGDVPVLPDAPNLGALRETCESWARHILTGTPLPGRTPAPGGHREWKEVAQFLVQHRHTEQELVATNLADLRRAVVVIADAVRGAVAHERADTHALLDAVGTLQQVATDGSLVDLRSEVRRAAEQLNVLAAERDARQMDLAEQVTALSDQVQVLVAEVRQAQQAGSTDVMTGLLNRAGYESAARRAFGLSLRTGNLLSLALIDLDDLKWVNDQHGHSAGDAAIRALSDSLRATWRTTDHLARIGGDEFAAILVDADARTAERIVDRFLQELWSRNIPVSGGPEPIRVSASVGIAQARSTDDLHAWTERADRWMYRAKSLGKNRVLGDGSPSSDQTPGVPRNAA